MIPARTMKEILGVLRLGPIALDELVEWPF